MRTDIHPAYSDVKIVLLVREHVRHAFDAGGEQHIELCNECHPFFTGKQKLVLVECLLPGAARDLGRQDAPAAIERERHEDIARPRARGRHDESADVAADAALPLGRRDAGRRCDPWGRAAEGPAGAAGLTGGRGTTGRAGAGGFLRSRGAGSFRAGGGGVQRPPRFGLRRPRGRFRWGIEDRLRGQGRFGQGGGSGGVGSAGTGSGGLGSGAGSGGGWTSGGGSGETGAGVSGSGGGASAGWGGASSGGSGAAMGARSINTAGGALPAVALASCQRSAAQTAPAWRPTTTQADRTQRASVPAVSPRAPCGKECVVFRTDRGSSPSRKHRIRCCCRLTIMVPGWSPAGIRPFPRDRRGRS